MDNIDSVGYTPPLPRSGTGGGLGSLGPDAFLQLLVAQLRFQNPLSPTDAGAMLQQTAQFTTVETLQDIAAMNQQLMGYQQVTMGLGLVGKNVDAIGLDGLPTQGIVESMRFTVDGPFLMLDNGTEIPMENIISVSDEPGLPPEIEPPDPDVFHEDPPEDPIPDDPIADPAP